jgi:hypothetical protein
MANKSGPDLVCETSDASKGPATFLKTKMAEMAVAMDNTSHSMTCQGIKQRSVAGMKATKLYPYKQIHSANVKACMDMHCVKIQNRVGAQNPKRKKVVMACRRWSMSYSNSSMLSL